MDAAETERSVVQRVLRGETDRFRDIVARYKGLVFHVVRSLIPNESDHDDLAQDIFIRVYRNLPRFRFRSGVATWISRIAYHTCLNHLRRQKRRRRWHRGGDTGTVRAADQSGLRYPDAGHQGSVPTPYAILCQQEIGATVRALVEELPHPQRLILTLHHLDGFGIPELSEMLDMPTGTIKSHLFRARAALRKSLLTKFRAEDLIECDT